MPMKQLTVFLENQAGGLEEVTRVLKEHGINLQGFYTTEAKDYGILRLVVSDTENACQALREAGFTTHLEDVICVEVEDRSGELYKIFNILAGEGISVDYMYLITGTRIVLSVADIAETEEVLHKNNLKLCG